VPVYNGAAHLPACLESILSQSLEQFEVVLIDDCSSDSSLEIAQRYAKMDSRVRVLRNTTNLGLVRNWNCCIEESRGTWIKYVFQDDMLLPQCLERLSQTASSRQPLVFCHREFLFDDSVDEPTKQHYLTIPALQDMFPAAGVVPASEVQVAVLRESRNFFGEPTCSMIHRSVFRRWGTFNPHLVQLCDLEFWIRVAVNTGFAYSPETLARFRVHTSSSTTRNRANRAFRAGELDRLVLLHEFAHHPAYAGLREAARQSIPPRDLAAEARKRSRWLRLFAHRHGGQLPLADQTLYEEWAQIVALYPRLRPPVWECPVTLRMLWDRHVGWRLRRRHIDRISDGTSD